MQDCVWLLTATYHLPTYFLNGVVPQRTGNAEAAVTPFGVYPAKDGSVLIVAIALAQVQKLFTVMGREDLIDSPLCSQQSERTKHKEEIDAVIKEWTKVRNVEEILIQLKNADVPCSMVPTFDQVCNDPQIQSREMVVEVEQLVSGKVKAPGSVFKLSKTPGDVKFPAPFHGEHNFEVYSGLLEYTEQEIAQLTKDGVI